MAPEGQVTFNRVEYGIMVDIFGFCVKIISKPKSRIYELFPIIIY